MSVSIHEELKAYLFYKLERSVLLGNHYKKNIRIIKEVLPSLIQRLSDSGTLPLFDFDQVSPFCYEEMELIRQLCSNPEEALDLLGCFYSHQLMIMNLNILESMEAGRETVLNPTDLYKSMLLQSEVKFSRLYSALLRTFLDILSEEEEPLPDLVLCHVGARRDQDDIDVGIVHSPGGNLFALNRVVGRLNREMYRRATQMHFYLSEHSGSKWFSASIEDYNKLMDIHLKNFVIITQLFGAVPITGSIALFEMFQERVVKKYTYRENADNRYYEGFMRGVVEEIRALVLHHSRGGEIVPKVDGLRLAKMIVTARRAALGIVGGHFWKAFDILKSRETHLEEEYLFLEEAISFFESVRFLYQLVSVQEEGIRFSDTHSRLALDRVALLMGYRETNANRPSTVLLRDYYRYSRKVKDVSGVFKEEFKKYVAFIRIFRGMANMGTFQNPEQGSVNMATDYIEVMERFHQVLPWGEFIGFLEEEQGYRQRFFQDLSQLETVQLRRTLEQYALSMIGDGETLIRFLLSFLKGPERGELKNLEVELTQCCLDCFRSSTKDRDDLFQSLLEEESLCSELVRNISPDFLLDFLAVIKKSKWKFRQRLFVQILWLSFQFHYRNPLLKRKMVQLVERGVIHEDEVCHVQKLRAVSKKIFKGIRTLPQFSDRYQALADYYDLETLRFSFRSIGTGHFPRAEYMDIYVRRLLRLAIQEAGFFQVIRDTRGFGFYATGGNARAKACENDYDMFMLYEPSLVDRQLLTQALKRIHRELARLGNMPHHRIGEQIGRFIVTVDELEAYLSRGIPEDFIERSELLGSRLVYGGAAIHQKFVETIIHGKIFREKKALIRSLMNELRDLHEQREPAEGLDLKLGRGGLFDLTLVHGILKANYEIYEPRDISTLQRLIEKDPSHEEDYRTLFQTRSFLTDARGIVRLTGYSDLIDRATDIRFPALSKGFPKPHLFYEKIASNQERAAEATDRLMKGLH